MRDRLAPVQLDRVRDATILEPGLEAQRHDEARIEDARQAADRCLVEMVVVVVRDQDEVDRRQIVEGNARRRVPADADQPVEGTGSIGPGGIGQEIQPVELYQDGGVTDPGHRRAARVVPQRLRIRRGPREWGHSVLRHEPGRAHDEGAGAHPHRGARVFRIEISEDAPDARGRREARDDGRAGPRRRDWLRRGRAVADQESQDQQEHCASSRTSDHHVECTGPVDDRPSAGAVDHIGPARHICSRSGSERSSRNRLARLRWT